MSISLGSRVFKMRFLVVFFHLTIFISESKAQIAPTMTRNKMGYFVLTNGGFTGNQVTDANCLSDLTASNWKGKAQAGPLSSARVRVFLCNSTTCTNLLPNSYYTFAVSGNLTYGGAVFVTDSLGRGPGNTSTWNNTNHFGNWFYWMGPRSTTSTSLWDTTPVAGNHCSNWTSGSALQTGSTGSSDFTDDIRWNDSVPAFCNQSVGMICMVDPS